MNIQQKWDIPSKTYHLNQVQLEGKWKGEVNAWAKLWEYRCINMHPEDLGDEFVDLVNEVADHKTANCRDYRFITINPPEETNREEFEGLWQEALCLKFMPEKVDYKFECSETGRYHLHAVFHSCMKRSMLVSRLYSKMKSILPDQNKIDVKCVTKKDALSKVHKYIHKTESITAEHVDDYALRSPERRGTSQDEHSVGAERRRRDIVRAKPKGADLLAFREKREKVKKKRKIIFLN